MEALIGIRLIVVSLMLSLALGLNPGSAQAQSSLLIVGDSLSDAYGMAREAGWAWLLDERLGPDVAVINASISGDTTLGGRNRLPGLIDEHAPDWLLIILGGNDGLRALSPAQLRANLAAMIEYGLAREIEVAIMQIRLPANLGPAYLRRFEGVYPELAEEFGVELLPFFLETIFDQPGMMMDDGIHPSVAAQPLMLEALWPHLQAWLSAVPDA